MPPVVKSFDFPGALGFVLAHEGGFVNDPVDPGGATNFGITQRTYDAWRWRDVRKITPEEVREIYESRYWEDAKCASIATTHPRVAVAHFDAAVNCGVWQANKFLQKAVGVVADGKIGPVTMKHLRGALEDEILSAMIMHRERFYHEIVSRKPPLGKFLKGWLARLTSLRKNLGIA